MDDRQIPPGPGKTAPRLIQDLLDHDPRYPTGLNVLAEVSPIWRGETLIRKDSRACRHSLCLKDNQSRLPISNDTRPGEDTVLIAAYCSRCRYHFSILIDHRSTSSGRTPCSLSDGANPLHQFRHMSSVDGRQYKEKNGINKYDTLTEAHSFRCTGSTCPVKLEIRISPPRVLNRIMASILDPEKMNERGTREIEKEPSRYATQKPAAPAEALGYLRQYLTDARTTMATGMIKKIARRNKKYMLAFADECDDLFEYLDFKPVEEPGEEGEESTYFWQLPTFGSENQNFLEDVVFELDLLLQARPASEKERSNMSKHQILQPAVALKHIERSLAYFDYPTRNRTIDLSASEHPHYLSLGAVENFTDQLLEWAYDRQCQNDPANKAYYLDCLEGIARGRDSSDLQMRVVMATSAGNHGLKAIEESYKFFDLTPEAAEGDDHIMGVYKSRIASAPRQKDEARQCLAIIAKHRESAKIEELVNDKTMTYEEALELLSVAQDTASDSIEASAIAVSLDGDKSRVAKALQVIANKRGGDFTLSKAAAQMESGNAEFSLNVTDAYNRLQLSNTAVPDETVFAYYQSLSGNAPAGSKDSYAEALRVIALERQSAYLLRKLDDPDADVTTGTADPVGLDNIGNTCYLNSLLQYYYTIKPVRNMVIDFESYKMPLTEQNIKNKKVGGRAIQRSEIVKAQQFVEELHNLFENLKTASSRSVKPSKELAELTIFSDSKADEYHRMSVSSPSGPPNIDSVMSMNGAAFGPHLPPRESSQASSATAEDDIEMLDRPAEKQSEAADDSSEATLVDMEIPTYEEVVDGQADQQPYPDEKDDAKNTGNLEDDVVMVDRENPTDEIISQPLPAPEKPPPIPPRNKNGLAISTESTKIIPDDDRWRFGTQQDVTEVIGNVTFRMQCAIKPASIEEGSGEQIDVIRDTFFGSSTTYTQKKDSLEKQVAAWPTLIVYPGDGVVRDIYEAIDVVFDEQKVQLDGETCPQYSSISKLPPVLQIQIQRTDFDKVLLRSSKNRTAVTFPETIYLDRYVDDPEGNSTILDRRRSTWKWKEQLRDLEARQEVLKNPKSDINVPDAIIAIKDLVNNLQEDEEEFNDIAIAPSLPEGLDDRLSEVTLELEELSVQIDKLKQSLRGQFMDVNKFGYKLHSVFIHRGEAGGGHYWVYIYDFERDIWREYNDDHVTEVQDRTRIFDQQGGAAGGTPYYLVYVRSSDQQDLVDPVCRELPRVQDVPTMTADAQNDITMADDGSAEDEQVHHIEHANPKPLRPKLPDAKTLEEAWVSDNYNDKDANGRPW